MIKILIWGLGKRCETALEVLDTECCEVVGFIDNNPEKVGKEYQSKRVYAFHEIPSDYDYLLIAVPSYKSILYQLDKVQFDMEKVIAFYDMTYIEKEKCREFMDWKAWKIIVLEEKLERLERRVEIGLSNIGYEIVDKDRQGGYRYPILASDEELVDKITRECRSFIRFGDGEFEIMQGKERLPYQRVEQELSERLREVISASNEDILIGIADNYGNLDRYVDETVQGIREYMTEETRAFHLSVLNLERVYYNAYVFKTFMPFKDKEKTAERVALIQRIWDDRDIVIVEGEKTRTGYHNDLFDNARSIKRLLCPAYNAYSKYDEILACGRKLNKDDLILVVLGPAGKILAYDLIQDGYQVVDIGQVDMDYDWYLSGVDFKVPNPDKYVSQLPPAAVNENVDDTYISQVIYRVE